MLPILVVTLAIAFIFFVITQASAKAKEIDRLEERISKLTAASGVKAGHEVSDTVRRLAEKGDYIGAIKQYQNETGASLAEAKKTVNPLMRW